MKLILKAGAGHGRQCDREAVRPGVSAATTRKSAFKLSGNCTRHHRALALRTGAAVVNRRGSSGSELRRAELSRGTLQWSKLSGAARLVERTAALSRGTELNRPNLSRRHLSRPNLACASPANPLDRYVVDP